MNLPQLSDQEFGLFQKFIYDQAGITLSPAKKALVSGRLARRLQHHGVTSFSEYFRLLSSGSAASEVQVAVDQLTTNETYFFREPRHFDFLRGLAAGARNGGAPFRAWSAASSSGEEAYSMAMVLADCMPSGRWEVLGSDVSSRVLAAARAGHYPMERARNMPAAYLKRFCLKGIGIQAGTLLMERRLRNQVGFRQINLNGPLPELGTFDVIFLRNVMIYFNADTKRQVVARVLSLLKPGGHFMIGHSETLGDITNAVQAVMPSIYRKD